MQRHLLLLTLLICSLSSKAQVVLYVDSSVASSNIGTTWPTAYKTLNEALVVANAGTSQYVINIAKGTYYPTRLQSGTNRDSAFLITRAGIELYGGFPTGGGTRNTPSNPTVLSGNINNTSSASDNSYHIMVIAGAAGTDSVILDGLHFKDGSATNTTTVTINGQSVVASRGAALYNASVAGPLYINNCNFLSNSASTLGGAIYNTGASPIINGSTFQANTATDGGAIWTNTTSTNRVLNSSFTFNTASRHGGAVYSDRSGLIAMHEFVGCTFRGNSSVQLGGAVYDNTFRSAPAHFRLNSFSSNTALAGGAIYISSDSTQAGQPGVIRSCAFSSNLATFTGGAVHAAYTRVKWSIDSCAFLSNRSNGQGGAVYVTAATDSARGTITNCGFTQDSAVLGGAIYSDAGHISISQSYFERNKALHGAALYNFMTTRSPVSNSIFSGNEAASTGGAILNYATDSVSAFTNCLITGNKAVLRGGGVYDSFSKVTIYNSTIANNVAPFGNGIASLGNSTLYVRNSIVWEGLTNNIFNLGAATITNSIVQSGFTGANNLTVDPLFVAPIPASSAPATGGDYRLQGCSPAINSGDNAWVMSSIDLDSNPRIYDTIVDRGAYEYPIDYPAAITGDTSLCVGNNIRLANYTPGGTWSSSSNGVAQINSSGQVTGIAPGVTTITYSITNACPATLTKTIRVDTVNSTVTLTGSTLISNQSGASYQWLNCLAGMAPVAGQINQTFTPPVTGQYAVAVSRNGCTDTSACFTVIGVGVKNTSNLAASLIVFPNPTSNTLSVQALNQTLTGIRLTDLTGKVLLETIPTTAVTTLNLSSYAQGLYLLEVTNGKEKHTTRISVVH